MPRGRRDQTTGQKFQKQIKNFKILEFGDYICNLHVYWQRRAYLHVKYIQISTNMTSLIILSSGLEIKGISVTKELFFLVAPIYDISIIHVWLNLYDQRPQCYNIKRMVQSSSISDISEEFINPVSEWIEEVLYE